MDETDIVEKKPIVFPCIAGFLRVPSLFMVGWAGPVFVEMFRDFGIDPLPLDMQIISRIRWFWIFSLYCLIAAMLISGSRQWARKMNLIVDVLSIVLAVTLSFAFAFTAFLPIFNTRS